MLQILQNFKYKPYLPMSDFPILRSVMSRVRRGEAVPERTMERERLNFVLEAA